MGKVSEHLHGLIEKQLRDHGIVVWYDPDGHYSPFCEMLSTREVKIVQWEDSFFRLRHELDGFLEFIDDEGRPHPQCHVPPKLLVYVPKARHDSLQALVELEAAGVVIEPGATPWQRNTRLRVIADQVFRKIAPDQAENICNQVEDGLLSLEELDKLSLEVDGIQSGAIKLIFGTVSLMDVALKFAASLDHDQALEAKQALPELAAFFEKGFGLQPLNVASSEDLRGELRRLLLMGEFLSAESRAELLERYSSLHLPEKTPYIERIREACCTWRNRTDLRPGYLEAAQSVEAEMRIADLDLPVETLSVLETFPTFEKQLIRHAEETLLSGEPNTALELALKRKASFWPIQEPTLQMRWLLIEHAAKVLILGKSIRADVKKLKNGPAAMVARYVEGEVPWCLLDRTYRHLERHYSYLDLEIKDDHATLEKLMARLRQDYTKTVELCAHRFIKALQHAEFQVSGYLSQDRVYPEKVAPQVLKASKVAYFVVDALRYEMGLELVDGLQGEFEVKILPGMAQLPTITAVGMAALMPGAEQGMELMATAGGKTAVAIHSSVLRDRASRIKHVQAKIGADVLAVKLKELVKPSRKRQQDIKDASFILVTSQEIDQFGEEIEDESEAHVIMDEVLDKLRKAVRNLSALGVQAFVICADHGHLFGETIDGGMLMDPPGGKTAELHRRVWIGQGGTTGDGFVRVVASLLHLGGPFELAFPRGLGCFKTKGGGGAYCHGGASLQELVIPVITLRPRTVPPYSLKTTAVKLAMEKAKVTARFFSITATYHRLHGIGSSEEIRIKAAVRANRKEVGVVAMAAYGFEEGSREILLRDGEPNALTLMLTQDQGLESITVHVLDAVSQVELTKSGPLPVSLAF